MITTHLPRLLPHGSVAAMLKSSHIFTYVPALRFSRLAMKQNPRHLSSYMR